MRTTSPYHDHDHVVKIEESPEPSPMVADLPFEPSAGVAPPTPAIDPKDPEGFLRRCSGYNKSGNRCSAAIGRNSPHAKASHATFLPTCHAHRDQRSFAGWCQFKGQDGQACGHLFRWTPPLFELCSEHQGHPDTPCYFLKLPLEIRLEIYRYLIVPEQPIGSSTHSLHRPVIPPGPSAASAGTPAMDPCMSFFHCEVS